MAGSKITITFADDVLTDGVITFAVEKLDIGIPSYKPETYYSGSLPRDASYRIPYGTVTTSPGYWSASIYAQVWKIDYNGGAVFKVRYLGNVVTIEVISLNYINWLLFSNFSSHDPNVTAVIENIATTAFTIDTVTYADAVVPCTHVEASITTSEVIPNIWLDGVQIETVNATNPYVLELTRGIIHTLRFINASGLELTYPSIGSGLYFEVLGVGNIDYTVTPSINGATLTFNYTADQYVNPPLVLEYSLNDIDWQGSNIFTGQGSGSGTVYIRDNHGCKINKSYTITDAGSRTPYLFISKANSINFKEYQEWDNYTIFKNDTNLLSSQGLEDIVYCEQLLFQTQDITKIQFKSNYDTPTVTLRKEDGTEVVLTLSKKTTNLNRFKSMDSMYYKYEEGFLGIYFTSGNTYDEVDIVNGTYTLNGNLPEFAIIGQYIEIDTLGTFKIIDIVFDSTINKKAIIVSYSHSGGHIATKVKSIYDVLPFEVYEFTIDWSIYGQGLYDVLIENTDTYSGTVQNLSENIWIQDFHEKTVAIRYYNENNRDIFYKFGIQNFIRIPYVHIEGVVLDEVEINITDLTSNIVDSSIHEVDRYHFEEVSKGVMRKLAIALSCENLFINGIGYIKKDNLEVENMIGTNLYKISANLLRSNINYNNNRQGQEGIDDGSIEFNIPPFVIGEGSFVKS